MLSTSFKILGEKNTESNKSEKTPQRTINSSRFVLAEDTVRTTTQLQCCFLVWDLTPWQQELPIAGIQQLTFQVFGTAAVLDGTPRISPGRTSVPLA